MFCKFCGTKINDDYLFCPNCGQRRTNVASGANATGAGTTQQQQQTANATQTAQAQITPAAPKTEIDKKVFMFMAIGAAIGLIFYLIVQKPNSDLFEICVLLFPIVYVILCMIINKYDFKSGALISLGTIAVHTLRPLIYFGIIEQDKTYLMGNIFYGEILSVAVAAILLLAVFITSKVIQKK